MEISFYNKSILNFINRLEEDYKSDISQAIDLLEKYGYGIRMPHSKSLRKGLFELRGISTGVRIIYIFKKHEAIILHIIIKKQNKIPKKDLDLAKKRQKRLV